MTGDKEWGTRTRSVTWTNKPPPPRKLGPENIMTKPRRLSREAQEADTTLELWKLFFTEKMLDLIVERTNQKIEEDLANTERTAEFLKKSPHLKPVDKVNYLSLYSTVRHHCLNHCPTFLNNHFFF